MALLNINAACSTASEQITVIPKERSDNKRLPTTVNDEVIDKTVLYGSICINRPHFGPDQRGGQLYKTKKD